MGRAPQISDDQILEAARTLFFREGFKASTAAIARHAGVSEGTLFRRFPSKEALFMEAMDFREMYAVVRFIEGLSDEDEEAPGLLLEQIIETIIGRLRVAFPRMMMLWANIPPTEVFASMKEPPPLRILDALTGWLVRQDRAGRLEVPQPQVLARMILGSSLHFVFLEATGLAPRAEGPGAIRSGSDRAYAAAIRELLFAGIAPREVAS